MDDLDGTVRSGLLMVECYKREPKTNSYNIDQLANAQSLIVGREKQIIALIAYIGLLVLMDLVGGISQT